MNKSDILNTFHKYAIFQRLLSLMEEDEAWGDSYLQKLVNMNFKSEMDLILYVRNN